MKFREAFKKAVKECEYIKNYNWPLKWTYQDSGEFWDTVKDYDEIDDETYAYKRRFYDSIKMCDIYSKSRVLDMDCRTGNGTVFFHRSGKVKEAVCVSPSKNFLKVAKERFKKYHVKADTLLLRKMPLPLKDESFDVILCFETIEHVSNHMEFLRELNRLLKDNGKMIFTMPNVLWEPVHYLAPIFGIHHSEGPHRFLTMGKVKKLLKKAGFKVIIGDTTVIIPAGPKWLTRLGEIIEKMMGKQLRHIFCLRHIMICKKYPK